MKSPRDYALSLIQTQGLEGLISAYVDLSVCADLLAGLRTTTDNDVRRDLERRLADWLGRYIAAKQVGQ